MSGHTGSTMFIRLARLVIVAATFVASLGLTTGPEAAAPLVVTSTASFVIGNDSELVGGNGMGIVDGLPDDTPSPGRGQGRPAADGLDVHHQVTTGRRGGGAPRRLS